MLVSLLKTFCTYNEESFYHLMKLRPYIRATFSPSSPFISGTPTTFLNTKLIPDT